MLITIFFTPVVNIEFSVISILLFIFVAGFCNIYFFKHQYFIKQRADDLVISVIIMFAPLLFVLLIFVIYKNNNTVVVVFSAYLATIGWLFSNYVSAKNSIRQHTITVLTQLRMSTEFMKNANVLQKLFDSSIIIDKDYYNKLIDEDSLKNKESIRYILNYLEFVAAGIRFGDLDEQLVRSAQGSMFITSFEKCLPLISELNSENKTTYENLIATYERWK